MKGTRLVAVLGYSKGKHSELHPVCEARLARAAEVTKPGDAVLFSGWRRRGRAASEAELMAEIWTRRSGEVLLDSAARTTYGNVLAAAAAARAISAEEIVLVTSGWHGRRASTLLRAASRKTVTLAATRERGTARARLREVACWVLVPLQIAHARRSR